jgi:DNA processing protein
VDSPTSAGCHKIIRDGGATLVTSMADVLDALGDTGSILRADADDKGWPSPPPPNLFEHNLTDTQQRIVEELTEPRDLDMLAGATGLEVHVIQADLTMLQIRGLIARNNGKFTRKR